jgi:hypothetical protein
MKRTQIKSGVFDPFGKAKSFAFGKVIGMIHHP